MDLAPFVPWLSLAAMLLGLGTALWNLFQSPAARLEKSTTTALDSTNRKIEAARSDATGEIEKLDRRLDAAESRLGTIEVEMRHLPDQDAAHRLELAVTELNGKMSVLDERLKPVAAIAERMQEIMMERGKA